MRHVFRRGTCRSGTRNDRYLCIFNIQGRPKRESRVRALTKIDDSPTLINSNYPPALSPTNVRVIRVPVIFLWIVRFFASIGFHRPTTRFQLQSWRMSERNFLSITTHPVVAGKQIPDCLRVSYWLRYSRSSDARLVREAIRTRMLGKRDSRRPRLYRAVQRFR